MTHLPDLIAAYAAMSPWARSLLLDIALDYAKKFPAPKKQANLTLVQSDIIDVQPAPDLLDHCVDCGAPVTVCKPVDGKKA